MKHLRLYSFLYGCLFLMPSCKSDLSQKEKQQLILVLESIHECEAFCELKYSGNYHQTLSDCKKEVFEQHHISENEFEVMMEKMKKNPDELDKMYDTIIVHLERKELK